MKKYLLLFFIACDRNLAGIQLNKGKPSSPYFKNSSPEQNNPWWLTMINYNNLPLKKSRSIVVGIIDTGVDPNHPALKNKLFVFNNSNELISATAQNYGYDFTKDSKFILNSPFDDVGHGTHVAGIIAKLTEKFSDIKIVVYKYYANTKNSNISTLDSTVRAINLAIQHGVDVINYSAGGREPSNKEKSAIQLALSKNIVFVSAAGNDGQAIGTNYFYYPGSYGLKNIIQVGNITDKKFLHPTSNYGANYVQIAAPGDSIRSSLPFSGYGQMTGTSQATPFVTSATAITKYFYPQYTYDQIISKVLDASSHESNLSGRIFKESLLNLAQL